jgi:hypothetical protein
MNIETLSQCIICLDIEKPDQKLYPIPCNCKAYIHKDCFQKIEEDECIICHQINTYSDQNDELKNYSQTENINKKEIDTLIEIEIEDNNSTRIHSICSGWRIQKFFSNISQKKIQLCKCINNPCPCFNIIMTIICWTILTYLIGLITRLLIYLIIRLSWYDDNVISHIFITFGIGFLMEFILVKCCMDTPDNY